MFSTHLYNRQFAGTAAIPSIMPDGIYPVKAMPFNDVPTGWANVIMSNRNVEFILPEGKIMIDAFETSELYSLINLFTDAVRTKLTAAELEREALQMRLNEARLKLNLAKAKLDEAGLDSSDLEFDSEL